MSVLYLLFTVKQTTCLMLFTTRSKGINFKKRVHFRRRKQGQKISYDKQTNWFSGEQLSLGFGLFPLDKTQA